MVIDGCRDVLPMENLSGVIVDPLKFDYSFSVGKRPFSCWLWGQFQGPGALDTCGKVKEIRSAK